MLLPNLPRGVCDQVTPHSSDACTPPRSLRFPPSPPPRCLRLPLPTELTPHTHTALRTTATPARARRLLGAGGATGRRKTTLKTTARAARSLCPNQRWRRHVLSCTVLAALVLTRRLECTAQYRLPVLTSAYSPRRRVLPVAACAAVAANVPALAARVALAAASSLSSAAAHRDASATSVAAALPAARRTLLRRPPLLCVSLLRQRHVASAPVGLCRGESSREEPRVAERNERSREEPRWAETGRDEPRSFSRCAPGGASPGWSARRGWETAPPLRPRAPRPPAAAQAAAAALFAELGAAEVAASLAAAEAAPSAAEAEASAAS